MVQPLLALRGVSKRFAAVQALVDVDLEIRAGEVVALVGANAAGKSTLVKVISGVVVPERGVIEWEGRPVQIKRPHDARDLGIATVYQDLSMCGNLDVVGNLFLGREIHRFGILDEVEMERRARELLRTLPIHIPDVRAPLATLTGGQRQVVAITRSFLSAPRLLLLDEPTASLGLEQTNQLLDLIEEIRDRGTGVLLISHNMGDIKAVADRVAVLRLGRNNGVFKVGTTSQEEIIASITGAADHARRHPPAGSEETWP
ncbi:D-xylose transport system ATP-binding protein [Streptomyces sp. Ag109_O5-1]|uniref:ATP-binding cassette domain-containing protein n=1 Tax=Streptomyces sp. Ag109_O5-1 TaxID=1938851 RepID=UPI000FAF3C11|nr:ATP-binding cassette domain-containing protein [Streptomyces sp. Ag109_O5-1]RPE42268.1 D-xylose transport system ATP-binding protein [Streptomyces sp. Ag109_O5-1]